MPGPLANQKYEKFAQLVAGGMTKREAWLQARDPNKPPLKNDAAVRQSATNWMNMPAVATRIKELQQQMLQIKLDVAREHEEKLAGTREWVIKQLIDNVKQAKREAKGKKFDGATANRALELLGKELGMFIERTENLNTNYAISDEPPTAEEWAERHTAH